MSDDDRHYAEAQSPLVRAVNSERAASAKHEAVARRLDQLAVETEQHALRERDEELRNRLAASAASAPRACSGGAT